MSRSHETEVRFGGLGGGITVDTVASSSFSSCSHIRTSSVVAGFGPHGIPPPASNPDL